jgi:hypothetical protein
MFRQRNLGGLGTKAFGCCSLNTRRSFAHGVACYSEPRRYSTAISKSVERVRS